MNKRQLMRGATALVCAALAGGLAQAQDFPPKKPVTLVVGFAAGGRTNTFLRGAISAMTEAPFSVSSVTSSPATGVIFCLRKMPRGLHSTMPSGVFT